jgi:hypothetical protein
MPLTPAIPCEGSPRPIDVSAVSYVENVDDPLPGVDVVDDAVRGAAGAVAADQRAEQRLAHLVRLVGQRAGAELEHRCGNGLG